jgi:hypothetical protein
LDGVFLADSPTAPELAMRPFCVGIVALSFLTSLGGSAAAGAEKSAFKAGVATTVITPAEPMWMAGYSARNKPAEGKVHNLYVKALALQDAAGRRLVLLTSDLIGLPRELTDAVAAEVRRRTGLPREGLLLTASHTHCGPVFRDALFDMYPMPPDLAKRAEAYTGRLRGWMTKTILAALHDLRPARLAVGKGSAGFAVNRRQRAANGTIINGTNLQGPVDHDVPVLRVETPEGRLRAVVFGYACHNTTMQFYRWCGDYAGFAQEELEKKHPGARALFWIGCGGDANPLPRGKIELCRRYGHELAGTVESVLSGKMTPIRGGFRARYAEISLPFDKLPTRAQLVAQSLSKNHALRKRAERYLRILEKHGRIENHYPHYPVQVWRLGRQVLWVALGGEVVIDYNRRLKKELGTRPVLWVTAYANDVMAYIPSARVLREGGYEADSSMVYYGKPARWAPAIENRIIGKVRELVQETGKN